MKAAEIRDIAERLRLLAQAELERTEGDPMVVSALNGGAMAIEALLPIVDGLAEAYGPFGLRVESALELSKHAREALK